MEERSVFSNGLFQNSDGGNRLKNPQNPRQQYLLHNLSEVGHGPARITVQRYPIWIEGQASGRLLL
jgi:hypothetical protein